MLYSETCVHELPRRVHVRSIIIETVEVVVVFQMNNIPAETGKAHGPWIPPTTFPSHTWEMTMNAGAKYRKCGTP
jgi:hypothetical protein